MENGHLIATVIMFTVLPIAFGIFDHFASYEDGTFSKSDFTVESAISLVSVMFLSGMCLAAFVTGTISAANYVLGINLDPELQNYSDYLLAIFKAHPALLVILSLASLWGLGTNTRMLDAKIGHQMWVEWLQDQEWIAEKKLADVKERYEMLLEDLNYRAEKAERELARRDNST